MKTMRRNHSLSLLSSAAAIRTIVIMTMTFTQVILSHNGVEAGLAPPHPVFYYENLEPVHEMRRKLGQQYDYEPQYIDPEHCRYLNETQCQALDEQEEKQQSYLDNDSMTDQQENRRQRRLNPSVGSKIRVLVLLIKFPENTRELQPREYYEELFNGDGKSDINPEGSVKEWLRYNSLGRYRVSFDVRDWETAQHDESYYAAGKSAKGDDLVNLFGPVMDKLDAANSIDWFEGYLDDFGFLNQLVVIHSGVQAEVGTRPCVPGSHLDRLWSRGSAETPFGMGWLSKDFYGVNGWMLTSAFTSPICNRNEPNVLQSLDPTTIGVVAHEYSHGFGLPDLYDQSGTMPVGGIGRFGVMSSLQGWDYASNTPGYLSAWSRARIGWRDPIVIEKDGFYAVQPLAIANSMYQIKHGYPDGEYLLIENKMPLKWDSDVPQGGIVIFHVDETARRQSERGYPGSEGWPTKHYRVALQQADGLYEIEKGENIGNSADFWVKGMKLSSGGSYPNTDAYQGGAVKQTGVSIEVLSDPGLIMVIKVTGITQRSAAIEAPKEDSAMDNGERVPNESRGKQPVDKDSTGQVINWILSLIGGLGLMVGVAMVML